MELYLEVNVLLKFVLLIWCNKQFLCICNARQRHGKGMERGMNPDMEYLVTRVDLEFKSTSETKQGIQLA